MVPSAVFWPTPFLPAKAVVPRAAFAWVTVSPPVNTAPCTWHKYAAGSAIQELPLPKLAIIPLSQHVGAPAQAKKHCTVACIGCGKCAQVCPVDAITIENNLAYIDKVKCISCRKCVPVCPTQDILTTIPEPKAKAAPEATAGAAPSADNQEVSP